MFMAIIFLLTLVTLILAPASTAGAISMEREKQTMDLLAVTPISSLAIVLGKLLSALSWILLLLLASIPVVALVFTFGGVSPDDVVRAYVVLLATAFVLRRDRPVRVRAGPPHPGGDRDQPGRGDLPDRRHGVHLHLLDRDGRQLGASSPTSRSGATRTRSSR